MASPGGCAALGSGRMGDMGMAEVTITVRKNGPYIVSGVVEVRDADGNVYPAKETVALCRCGASTNKPFCDGTHSKVGFQAAERAVPG
jgi:CDGSH-type Zn-finger protein